MNKKPGIRNQMADDVKNIQFNDFFDRHDIQRLQDLFSDATGVASLITLPDGTPITRSGKGCKVWNACESIDAGGIHLANWLIGKVSDGQPAMSDVQFKKVSDMLLGFTIELSEKADKILQLKIKIADSIRAEETMKASEASMRSLIGNVDELFIRYDLDLRYQYVSQNISNFFNLQPEYYIGKTHQEVGYPDEQAIFLDNILKKVIETGKPLDVEFDMTGRNGVFSIEARAYPEFDPDGNIRAVVTVSRDVTERKVAESRRNQQFLFTYALNEIAEAIISDVKSEGLLETANRIVGETLKLDRALIYDISFEKNRITSLCEWLGIDHPDIEPTLGAYASLDMFRVPFTEIRETKNYLISYSNCVNEHFTTDESGVILHEQLNIKSLLWYPFAFDNHGYFVFTLNQILQPRQWTQEEIGFLKSVAKQVNLALVKIRLLEERKLSEKRLQDIIAKNPLSIQIVDKDGFTVSVNSAHTRLFGALPPPGYSMFNDAQLEQQGYRELFARLKKGEVVHFPDSYFNVHDVSPEFPDNPVWLRGVVFTLYDTEEKPERFVFMHENITDRIKAEGALKEALGKAESGNRLKTAFMNNISHELRTPLNGILGFSELLIQPGLSDEEKESFYNHLKISSDRLINTINNYMDISLIATGNMEVNRELFNPDELIHRLYEQFKPMCNAKNLKIFMIIPETSIKVNLNSDFELLRKALSQLLDNAGKFTTFGNVSFGYDIKPGFLEFFVKDTGMGISREAHNRIFENFVQEETSLTRGFEGSGLGLPISQGIVRLLGGEIRVESNKGFGSTFFFDIPYNGNENETATSGSTEEPVVPIHNKPVVLIAEDDETNRFYLEKILTARSIMVYKAINGKEAVKLCRAHPEIALVLMDLKMPVMDGFEATRAIKSFRQNLPVIAITAFAMSSDKAMAVEAGCDDYLSKPITRELLIRRLKRFGLIS